MLIVHVVFETLAIGTDFGTELAGNAGADDMLGINVLSHMGFVLGDVLAVDALPSLPALAHHQHHVLFQN